MNNKPDSLHTSSYECLPLPKSPYSSTPANPSKYKENSPQLSPLNYSLNDMNFQNVKSYNALNNLEYDKNDDKNETTIPPLHQYIPHPISPIKCVKNELHNVLAVLRLTLQSNSKSKSHIYNETDNPLVKSFQTLFDSLTYVNEFYIETSHLLPFLHIIENNETNAPTTTASLAAIHKFVSYNIIHPYSENCSETINVIASSVLACKFRSSGTIIDEVVQSKILEVLIDTLRCPAGVLLSDKNVWKMVKKCYEISHQYTSSHLLRNLADRFLMQIILTVFGSRKICGESIDKLRRADAAIFAEPYGVGCMYKILNFFASLMSYGHTSFRRIPFRKKDAASMGGGTLLYSSDDEQESDVQLPLRESESTCDEMRSLGLSLLNVALETGGEEVTKSELLIKVVQNKICKSLLQNARTESLYLLSLTLRCVFNLFLYFKKHLKVQLEVFFNSMQLRIAGSRESTTQIAFEQKELALESLLEFCREPDLMVELYENYDCDIHFTNLFETLVRFTSRHALPNVEEAAAVEGSERGEDGEAVAPFNALNRLALSGLLAIIRSIALRCTLDSSLMHRFSVGCSTDEAVDVNALNQKKENVRDRKNRKNRLSVAAQIFNADPEKCCSPLQNIGLQPIPATAQSMASFIKETPGLDMKVVGEYLAKNKKWNRDVCKAFVKTFDFTGQPIVTALREFLAAFRLPGESQHIERMMEAFSTQFFITQPVVGEAEEFMFTPEDEGVVMSTTSIGRTSSVDDDSPNEVTGCAAAAEEVTNAGMDIHKMSRWVRYESDYWKMKDAERIYHIPTIDETSKLKCSHTHAAMTLSEELKEFDEKKFPDGYSLIKSSDTIFILSYSIIMLNTDLHNTQVKSKMKLEEFIRNNRGINDGSDLCPYFLADIYDTIRNIPISLQDEHLSHNQPDEIYWDRILRKQQSMVEYSTLSSFHVAGVHERDMFLVIWDANVLDTLTATCYATRDTSVIEQCFSGFWSIAHIATYFHQIDAINATMKRLSEFTDYSLTIRCQLALPCIIQCLIHSAHLFRDCWYGAVEVLLRWNSLGLLPPSMTDFDDFTDANGKPLHRFYDLTPPEMEDVNTFVEEPSGKYYKWITGLTSILFPTSSQESREERSTTDDAQLPEETAAFFIAPSPTWCRSHSVQQLHVTSTRSTDAIDSSLANSESSQRDGYINVNKGNGGLNKHVYSPYNITFNSLTKTQLRKIFHHDLHLNELITETIKKLPKDSYIALAEALLHFIQPPLPTASVSSPTDTSNTTSSDKTLSLNTSHIEGTPLFKTFMSNIYIYRNVGDPIFCLELLTNLLCQRMMETRVGCPSESVALKLWRLGTSHLSVLLRRYVIQTALQTIVSTTQNEEEVYDQTHTEETPGVFEESGVRRCSDGDVEAAAATPLPSALQAEELIFVERLVVNVLRLYIQVAHAAEERQLKSMLQLLHLIAHLHPNIFHLHTERIISALQLLVAQWDFNGAHCFYGVQVILILFQRIAPILSSHHPHASTVIYAPSCVSTLSAIESLNTWLRDSSALRCLTQLPHYQAVLQTLLVFALHNASTSCSTNKHDGQLQLDYTTNLRALELLSSLLPNIISAFVEEASSTHNFDESGTSTPSTEAGMPEWKVLWLPTVEAVGLVAAFGSKCVRIKALASLQKLFLGRNLEVSQPMPSEDAAADITILPNIENSRIWREGVRHVLFPLISYDFHYPCSKYYFLPNTSSIKPNPYILPSPLENQPFNEQTFIVWMADALKERYTLKGAQLTLGEEEIWSRKTDSVSCVCRTILSRLDMLLPPKMEAPHTLVTTENKLNVDINATHKSNVITNDIKSQREDYNRSATNNSLNDVDGDESPLGFLLPILIELVKLLVKEAQEAPVLLYEQYLEVMKNVVLVVATTPAVERIKQNCGDYYDSELLMEEQQLKDEEGNVRAGRILVMTVVKRYAAAQFPAVYDLLLSILLPEHGKRNNSKHTEIDATPKHSTIAANGNHHNESSEKVVELRSNSSKNSNHSSTEVDADAVQKA